jgi:hypothetical protein
MQKRGFTREDDKQVDEQAVADVDQEVEYMVTGNIQAVQSVVQCERQVADVSVFKGIVFKVSFENLGLGRFEKEPQVLNDGILLYGNTIIEMERRMKGVGICDQAEQDD